MGAVGWIGYYLHGPLRRKAMANVRIAFGDKKSEGEMRRIVRCTFVQFFWIVVDFLKAPRHMRAGQPNPHVEFAGFDQLEQFKDRPTGILFLTGHLGSFELAGHTWGFAGYPLNSVSRPLNNPYLNEWAWKMRKSLGQGIIPRQGAMRTVLRTLKRGQHVAMLSDQNQRKKPVFVPFFGRPAATVRSPALIALRLGTPVVLGWSRRLGARFRFKSECIEIIHPPAEGTQEEKTLAMMLQVNRALERTILKYPELYFWFHDRWKTRPPEEKGT